MLARLGLSTRFTLLFSIIFIGGMIASGLALWRILERKAQEEMTTEGLMLIEALKSVRGYTDTNIKPLLDRHINTDAIFIAETVPAFSARTVFEGFRRNQNYGAFSYKEASLNPTNQRNKADDFEAGLIVQMRNHRAIRELSGFRTLGGQDFFYIARPLVVASPSCLTCHSVPEVAPKGLIEVYGSENGFGWQLNDVVATQIIYVPADAVFNTAFRSFLLVMEIVSASFIVVILIINILLREYVIEPVSIMGRLAKKISSDEMVAEDLRSERILKIVKRTDELGYLANAFRDMAHEVYTRTENLKQQVQQLRIEVDEQKRQKDVETIVESDYFKNLQTKARTLRRRHQDDPRRTLQLPQVDLADNPGRTLQLPQVEIADNPDHPLHPPRVPE